MIRKSCIPHGKDEVLVVFEEDGETRNHLLRGVPELRERYAAHEASVAAEREGEGVEAGVQEPRDDIDAQAFAAAEAEIAAAAMAAAEGRVDA